MPDITLAEMEKEREEERSGARARARWSARCDEELTAANDDACCCGLSLFTSCSSTVSTSPLLASSVVDLVMMSTNRHIASFISARGVGVGRVGRYVVDVY